MAKKNSKVDATWDRFTKLVANRLLDEAVDPFPNVPKDGEIPLAKAGAENGIGKGLIERWSAMHDKGVCKDSANEVSLQEQKMWCLCEAVEGEFPVMRVFPELEGLVQALAEREGKLVHVWPMYGLPLQLTQSFIPSNGKACRFLRLPNTGKSVLVVKGGSYGLVDDTTTPDIELQQDGWLGDPDYVAGDGFFQEGILDDEFSADEDLFEDD